MEREEGRLHEVLPVYYPLHYMSSSQPFCIRTPDISHTRVSPERIQRNCTIVVKDRSGSGVAALVVRMSWGTLVVPPLV
jgi:hypothetical protein